jgi:UDP-N-acetyl-D-galactosamine dehydrogenase
LDRWNPSAISTGKAGAKEAREKMLRIAVNGLGYVGLLVALALSHKFSSTVGYDIDAARIKALTGGEDWTGEVERAVLKDTPLNYSDDESAA